MKSEHLRFISSRIAKGRQASRFLNFARMVALISVMLGTIALIVSLSVIGGFDKLLKENAVKFTSHIKLRTINNSPIPDYFQNIELIKKKYPEIKSIAPLIEREGLVRHENYVDGIMIRSYDKNHDITNIADNLLYGQFDTISNHVVIGKRLARKLSVDTGSTIILYSIKQSQQGGLPNPKIGKFVVSGIYETGMAMYDDIVAYLPFEKAQSFGRFNENEVSSIEIMLDDVRNSKAISNEIEVLMGYPFFALTVYDLHSYIFSWIELQKKPIPIVLGLISVVAVLNIITTLLIAVVEKTRSIGILSALGMSSKKIIRMFIYQGIRIGGIGSGVGAGLAFLATFLQQKFNIISLRGEVYFLDSVPIEINASHYIIVIGISLLLSFLSTLIPAYIAVRISPVRAITFR